MGKEYWYWGGKTSKRGRGAAVDRDAAASAGCMCAVFQLFDFHQFQLANLNQAKPSLKPTSFLPEEPDSPKGVEAPRNSLKSEEGTSLSSIIEEEEEEEERENLNLNIPMGIQIKTNGGSRSSSKAGGGALSDISSDTSSSPVTKTPGLVARLMGLDLLPEANSPTFTTPPSIIHSSQNHLKRLPLRPRQPQLLQTKARHCTDTRTIDQYSNSGTRSLPETPRISSARRSDVDYHHRLSLQINKENNVNGVGFSTEADLDFSKLSALRRKQLRVHGQDHHSYETCTKSPGHYARQIVKQVKESVSRRVGLADMTNTCRNREYHQSRDELVKQLNSKKVPKGLAAKLDDHQASRAKNHSLSISSTSCSPRLRFSTDPKATTTTTTTRTTTTTSLSTTKDQSFQISRPLLITSSTNSASSPVPVKVSVNSKPSQENGHQGTTSFNKSRSSPKKAGREGFGARLQKMQEETFVRSSTATRTNIPDKNKCKKTPLSNNLLNLSVPTLLSVKKSPNIPLLKQPVEPAAEVSDNAQESKRRSSQLSSSRSQKYQPKTEPHALEPRDNTTTNDVIVVDIPNGTVTATTNSCGGASDLYQYISRILFRTGIARTSHVSFTNWFSPSHPLDPSIFQRLENSFYLQDSTTFANLSPQFRVRSNRRLVFDVVDEILVEILKPYMNLKPWSYTGRTRGGSRSSLQFWIMHGSQLIDTLCSRVESFPSRDCQVLEDIDGLIDRDLPQSKIQSSEMAFEEEGEGLVMEIERDILVTLVHETTMVMVGTITY
ncbi:LOW protein: M-phase inducer phosphatase-like protein [Parasponia andersonii]|uniref:LOW protein: M-phase inducer phosphatase-like protein n=1 Tax=Parasponia andersonii TaxID=3476 RepID=A0A2P5D9I8_PARAD|nr:LOW protein: M-phase inducer phosphatase-like protein [Parasponia andersonii]